MRTGANFEGCMNLLKMCRAGYKGRLESIASVKMVGRLGNAPNVQSSAFTDRTSVRTLVAFLQLQLSAFVDSRTSGQQPARNY